MIKSDYKIRCVADVKCTLGEGPVWDDKNELLYWVDIIDNKIFRLDPKTEKLEWWNTPEHVGFIVLKLSGGLIGGFKTGLHKVTLKDSHEVAVDRIDRVDESLDYIRFNDGFCDNQCRIWGCTMDMNQKESLGKFYCYDSNLNRSVEDEGYVVANGPALSPDGRYLYTVETVGNETIKQGIYVADANDKKTPKNKKFLIDWGERSSLPDGIIVDGEGDLWIGEFGGNHLRSYSPEGELKKEITIPSWNITKPVFGGPNRDILYVTSARLGVDDDLLKKYPQAGGIFEIKGVASTGQPSSFF